MADEHPLDCARCSAVWQKNGTTHCWSDPNNGTPTARPLPFWTGSGGDCRFLCHYTGEDADARLARVAAKVEGLCYQPIPGSDAVNARWTRVEDTIALAKLMG